MMVEFSILALTCWLPYRKPAHDGKPSLIERPLSALDTGARMFEVGCWLTWKTAHGEFSAIPLIRRSADPPILPSGDRLLTQQSRRLNTKVDRLQLINC